MGVLFTLVGLAAAAYGMMDQRENKETSGPLGVGEDRERSEQNQLLLYSGAAAMAIGLITLVFGIILLAVGGARARRLPGAQGPAVEAPRSRKAKATLLLSGVAGFLVVGFFLLMGADGAPAAIGVGGQRSALLGEANESGSMPPTFTFLGLSQSAGTSEVLLDAVSGTERVDVEVNWTPSDLGAQELHVELQHLDGDYWRALAEVTGPPGVRLAHQGMELDGARLRVIVFLGEDGASQGQDFTVDAWFWRGQ